LTEKRALNLPVPDYEVDDVLVVSEPEQLRALAGDRRARIIAMLREHARSTTELAAELGLPKGTVGHHLKVLEKAGLIRVVRTRRVRAVTEMYYGRVARLFVIKSSEPLFEGLGPNAFAAQGFWRTADELANSAGVVSFASLCVRLSEADARRFKRRLDRLVDDFRAGETADGEPHALVFCLYPAGASRG
jgi:DNA-binding transcriptional ArsR family regulator